MSLKSDNDYCYESEILEWLLDTFIFQNENLIKKKSIAFVNASVVSFDWDDRDNELPMTEFDIDNENVASN